MTERLLGLAQFLVLTAGLFAAVTAVAVAALHPWLRPRLQRVAPARRARLLTALALAPVTVAALNTLLCFLPGALGKLWPWLDHCAQHVHDGHPHLCFVHLPGHAGTTTGWAMALGLGVAFAAPLARQIGRVLRSRRLLAQLLRTTRPAAHAGLRVVDTELPIAAATALCPDVIVSAALLRELEPELLEAVIEHERAHLRRGDTTRRLVAALACAAHLPWVRRRLLADLELAAEQASDEEAGAQLADRFRVARALVAVERLFGAARVELGASAAAFGSCHTTVRVQALLAPPLPGGSAVVERRWLLGALLLSIALTDPIHHAAESLVGLLGG